MLAIAFNLFGFENLKSEKGNGYWNSERFGATCGEQVSGPACRGIIAPGFDLAEELDRKARSIEVAGSFFVLGLAGLLTLNPLPAVEMAARFALACWTLTAFRLTWAWDGRWLRVQALVQVGAMALLAFLLPWPERSEQLAVDLALVGAGWIAIGARWHLMLAAHRLARLRADGQTRQWRVRAGLPA